MIFCFSLFHSISLSLALIIPCFLECHKFYVVKKTGKSETFFFLVNKNETNYTVVARIIMNKHVKIAYVHDDN